jgi:hypothetical protein
MRSWLRKELGWFVLAVTLLAVPGPASTACACARMSNDSGMSQANRGEKKECSRCASAASVASAASHSRPQLSRPSCCKSKVTDAHAAETPAKLQLERHETRTAAPAAVTPSPAVRGIRNRSVRAPPPRGSRDSAAPPSSYLSDYLRL